MRRANMNKSDDELAFITGVLAEMCEAANEYCALIENTRPIGPWKKIADRFDAIMDKVEWEETK